jgi:hypothetical protein
MPPHRLIGLTDGAVDTVSHEIHFSLAVHGRPPIPFITEYGPATQTIGALGRMFVELQTILENKKTGMAAVAAESVAAAHIQKERWNNDDVVIFQLTTMSGIPYNFVIPRQAASDIADRLKTESAKPHVPPGSA